MKINDLADLELIKDVFSETDLVVEDTDREITCEDCGKTFIFSVGEQQFYKERHLREPKRCKECAKKRRMKFLNYK